MLATACGAAQRPMNDDHVRVTGVRSGDAPSRKLGTFVQGLPDRDPHVDLRA